MPTGIEEGEKEIFVDFGSHELMLQQGLMGSVTAV